jgi:hypothetical protein
MLIQPYTSYTGTKTTHCRLEDANWRYLLGPYSYGEHHANKYALDNGAWHAHQQHQVFDELAFGKLVDKYGAKADWIVLPDIVGGGLRSLEFSLSWLNRLSGLQLLIAVQDGMIKSDIASLLNDRIGIFLGGSTEWKLRTGISWGKIAKGRCRYHIARVNSARRILWAITADAASFDGTSAVQFPSTIKKLSKACFKRGLLSSDDFEIEDDINN